jgi:adenylylsulfate reductase subunit B
MMHIDKTYRRAIDIEPNMCWECCSCVKACPQNAIDLRGYADFAPLGHSVRVLREEDKGTVSWKIKFRDGREKNFESPNNWHCCTLSRYDRNTAKWAMEKMPVSHIID